MGLLTWWRKSDAKVEDKAGAADAKIEDEARNVETQMADASDKPEPPRRAVRSRSSAPLSPSSALTRRSFVPRVSCPTRDESVCREAKLGEQTLGRVDFAL